MNRVTMIALAASLMPIHEVSAQLFKCTDAAGKITYTSMSCRELGLKDAGEVQDRIQVQPALKTPARPPSRAQDEAAAKPAAQPPATEETPPDRRCFTIRNAKGATVTRCNDKPDED